MVAGREVKNRLLAWTSVSPAATPLSDHELTARETMGWIRALNAKGWGAPGWPKEYGGMGLPPHRQVIFAPFAFSARIQPMVSRAVSS